MERIPPMTISKRIALLKERFEADITFEDFGLRSKVYQKVAAENPGVNDEYRQYLGNGLPKVYLGQRTGESL